MSAMLRIAGDGGRCCACGDVDGCDCRKCSKLECRSRGGLVSLCGWPEFGEPSEPPRFYLQKEFGGSVVLCDYNSPDGKGPCWEGDCPNPVGQTLEIASSWNCPGGPTGTDTYATGTLVCTGAVGIGGGQVRLSFDLESTFSQSGGASGDVSWLAYINASIAGGGYKAPGKASFTRDAAAGTALTTVLQLDTTCSPSGNPPGGAPNPSCVGSACSSSTTLHWCVPLQDSIRYAYSGVLEYDPALSCELTSIETAQRETIDQPFGCVPPTSGGSKQDTVDAFEPALSGLVELDPISNQTLRQQRSNGLCDGDLRVTHCDRYEALQVEDSDEDALARMLGGPGGVWSAWQIVLDGTGGTCVNPVCCMAAWEIRLDRNFLYREAEWRATIEGLAPGTPVTIKIKVYRRPFGTLTWAEFEDHEYDRTADGEGKAQVTGVTPNAEGFETYVGCSYNAPEEAP